MFLTDNEAAELTGMSPIWFRDKRYRGGDQPPFIKLGRAVRYERDQLIAWFRARQVTPT